MSNELKTKVSLKQEEEMIFKCDLGQIKMDSLYIDEKHDKNSERIGPSPVKLLALSVLGCLAASFSFCLKKKEFLLSDLRGHAEVRIARNDKHLWRVKKIDVKIIPKIDTPELRKRADQCAKFFEQYCIISESLRNGIEVNFELEY
ncbi:MAG: OsmC family protein [Candidatus Thorarchaeota archaeon]